MADRPGTFLLARLSAKQAVTLLRLGNPISDAVHKVGYFDQPHLTKSLKQWIGHTPA